jgi:mRNA interferase MazF
MLERGNIYLAKLNPARGAEPGKVRPVLVFQDNALNEVNHSTVIILPLTTNLIDDAFPLRFRLSKREQLDQDSDILCDQIRAIDIQRVMPNKIADISVDEVIQIEQMVQTIIGIT